MGNRLLLVAFHFPPIQGSTGVSRTLATAKYLRELGWDVIVLTAHERAYEATDDRNRALIPEGVRVERAWCVDARRHLSVSNRYPRALALPDRWQSWIAGGVIRGLSVVRRAPPDVIMSTYPIASAHCIGYALHRATGLPWVAEFRDPMAQDDYPVERIVHRCFGAIERGVFRHASRVIVTTRGTADLYRTRFPTYVPDRIVEVPNGFDPELFENLEDVARRDVKDRRPLRFLHSGLLYTSERNPVPLFHAIAKLRRQGTVTADQVQFDFRASGTEAEFGELLQQLDISDIVRFLPPIPYVEALREMVSADALLLLQAKNCNAQVPAKLYEYLRCQLPIIALTDAEGDTARTLRQVGLPDVVPLEDAAAIEVALPGLIMRVRSGTMPVVSESDVAKFSRRSLVGALATTLDEVVFEASRAD